MSDSENNRAAGLSPGRNSIDRREFCDFVVSFAVGKSGADPAEVTWDTDIIGLMDSIAIFELFSRLEERYGISIIPVEFDINDLTSTRSLYELCSGQ